MKKLIALLIALTLMAGMLAACTPSGGGGTPPPTTPDAPPAENGEEDASDPADESDPATTPGELEVVTLVVPRGLEALDDMCWWSAVWAGYFEEEGLQLNIEQAFGVTDLRMVAMGHAEFAWPNPNLLLAAVEEGLPVVSVSRSDAINIFGMAVREDSGINSWEDMRGKTIVVGDIVWQTIFTPTLVAAGFDDPINDFNWVVGGDARYQVVNEGQGDILATWVSEYFQLIGMGFEFKYFDGNEALPVLANPLVTSWDIVNNRPDLVTKVTRAKNKGLYFVLSNPEAAADIILNQFPAIEVSWDGAVGVAHGRNAQAFGTSEAEKQEILDLGIGYQPLDRWELVMEWAVRTGVISDYLDMNLVFTNDLLDLDWDRAQVEADAASYTDFSSRVYREAH